jgi:hypothetical protein
MANDKKFKWELSSAINAGKRTYALASTYRSDLEARLQPDELEQLNANIIELEQRRAGQTESLIDQKAKTISQGEAIVDLHDAVIGIRGIVKGSSSVTSDILKAYGVGERLSPIVSSVIAAGNIIITAYNENVSWSNSAGIIEADITEISELVNNLSLAEKLQNNSMFTRKAKTMNKNILQRTIEDEVTKISAIGQHIFRKKDAAVVKLFEELMPGTIRSKNEIATDTSQATDDTTPIA